MTELQNVNCAHEEKLQQGGATEQTISWDIEELKTINNEGCRIYEDLLFCLNLCSPGLFQQHNIAK